MRVRTLTVADEQSLQPRRFLVQVDETLNTLLKREDSDGNYQITIDDKGPKVRWQTEEPVWRKC